MLTVEQIKLWLYKTVQPFDLNNPPPTALCRRRWRSATKSAMRVVLPYIPLFAIASAIAGVLLWWSLRFTAQLHWVLPQTPTEIVWITFKTFCAITSAILLLEAWNCYKHELKK